MILKSITKINLNTSILLVGFDNNKAKILEITDFKTENYNPIHFHTIGSKTIQAQNTLLFKKTIQRR